MSLLTNQTSVNETTSFFGTGGGGNLIGYILDPISFSGIGPGGGSEVLATIPIPDVYTATDIFQFITNIKIDITSISVPTGYFRISFGLDQDEYEYSSFTSIPINNTGSYYLTTTPFIGATVPPSGAPQPPKLFTIAISNYTDTTVDIDVMFSKSYFLKVASGFSGVFN